MPELEGQRNIYEELGEEEVGRWLTEHEYDPPVATGPTGPTAAYWATGATGATGPYYGHGATGPVGLDDVRAYRPTHPTKDDLAKLEARIVELEAAVQELRENGALPGGRKSFQQTLADL